MSRSQESDPPQAPAKRRGNELDGRAWTRNSISVWSDIRFSGEERALKHPAMFPAMLVERLIACFTSAEQQTVLDPFLGSGSTLVAAQRAGKRGIGFELYPEFAALTRSRIEQRDLFDEAHRPPQIIEADARTIAETLPAASVDFCVTSPPYWNILQQRRTADHKRQRDYGDHRTDLGGIPDYTDFLQELQTVFAGVFAVLKPRAYCVVNVMDLRKGPQFFPLHSDLASRMQEIGFAYDDLIVWDRRADYNNLRPLGFPSVFRINKVHEFLLIFRKPA
ncbi:MAG: DNA methyltransferase [Planctomycetaceae bacterium]